MRNLSWRACLRGALLSLLTILHQNQMENQHVKPVINLEISVPLIATRLLEYEVGSAETIDGAGWIKRYFTVRSKETRLAAKKEIKST
jgi:hypothetical protein